MNFADSAAMAISVVSDRLKPPPAAVPFMAPTTGASIQLNRDIAA